MNTKRQFALSMVLLAVLMAVAGFAQTADPVAAEVDAIFADYDNTTSPGCSLGVIRDGELIYKRGYGMANLEYGIALSPRSVFRTGSVGKQFTAMAIALLAQEGIISLDDSIRKLFPEFPSYTDNITIWHLIHHTSGIRDYLELAWMAGLDDEGPYTDEFALELIARQKNTNFQPGDEYLYSNSGYFLLSHVVKRATGRTLREWAAENIFGPLGMKDTHFHDDHTHIVANRADGYAPSDGGYHISMTTLDMVGDGGVFTTVEDLLLWDRNFYDNKLGAGGPELIDLVTTPSRLNNGDNQDYAFGLGIETYRGLSIIRHSGGFVGFRAQMIRFPDQQFSVTVLCNRADADPTQRAIEVAELYLTELMEPKKAAEESGKDDTSTHGITAREAEPVIGYYWQEDDRMSREIRFEDGKLLYLRSEESQTELAPLGGHRFVMVDVPVHVDVWFESPGSTEAKMLTKVEDDETHIYNSYEKRAPTTAELTAYSGTYYSEELGVEYVLDAEDAILRFSITRHEKHELEALFDEIFANSDYGAFEFRRTSDGAVAGFMLTSGRVRGVEFIRR